MAREGHCKRRCVDAAAVQWHFEQRTEALQHQRLELERLGLIAFSRKAHEVPNVRRVIVAVDADGDIELRFALLAVDFIHGNDKQGIFAKWNWLHLLDTV